MGSFLPATVAFAIVAAGLYAAVPAAAVGCQPGWTLVSEYDNSFFYDGGMYTSAKWTGSVQLWENLDSDCYVHNVRVTFTGPNSGGQLDLKGMMYSVGVYFSVQYPEPYTQEEGHEAGTYGEAVAWNPDGDFVLYYAHVHFDINAWGADEYFVGTKLFVPVTITGVYATFELPLELVGKTVHAQLHVYPNLCQCEVTSITIPGSPPPPPPPPPQCSDGVDNDGDGLVDYPADPGCTDGNDDDETDAPPAERWSVFVHAHNDDWQLFQTPNSISDYRAGYRLLFIYLTAGDAGLSASYWQGREEGAMASVRFIVGDASDTAGPTAICYTDGGSTVCHDIWRRDYGTTVSLFMRLPDGGVDGRGFPATGFQSLARLRDGEISSISAIDGSTTYGSWRDLYLTVAAGVSTFTPYDSTTVINAPDFDRVRQTAQSPGCPSGCPDHSDHLATADAVYEITIGAGAPWSRIWFINYPLAYGDPRYLPNLSPTEYQEKRDLFMAYNNRLRDLTGFDTYATDPLFYERCFERNYYRTV